MVSGRLILEPDVETLANHKLGDVGVRVFGHVRA